MSGFNQLVHTAAVAAIASAILCGASPARAQAGDTADYDLPAQELALSIREIGRLSGTNIIAPAGIIAGLTAPAVQGRFAPEAALQLVLGRSGLTVVRMDGAFVIGRERAAEETGSQLKPRAGEAPEREEIIVTGTNLRGSQPTSPVTVLGRRDIEASGSGSVERLLAQVPQNAQSGVNRENVGAPGAGQDPTEHGSGLNLRGLGQRATLVLINGRRVAPSGTGSFVDVSLIPLAAVERVEILTDGASAIYGSDAVGGVVNFILRQGFQGLEAALFTGTATRGGGDVLQAAATGGTSWRGGGAMLSYEYRAEDEILAGERDFTINLVPGTFLFPRERRHSFFGNFHQELSDRLRVELTGSYAHRDTDRSYFFVGSPAPVATTAEADTMSISGSLRHALGQDWSVQIGAGYSLTSTEQQQSQPEGQGLVNDRSTRNEINDLTLKFDGGLAELPAGPVRIAFGAEARQERYRERFRTRRIDTPTAQAREVKAGFAEVQLPLFSSLNRMPGLERLILSAAARVERYERFGTSLNPKVGLLWSPAPGLAFRTSYDTSFRAPLLSETSGVYSAVYLPARIVFIDPASAQGVALALGGSNPDVRPERSRSWTIGTQVMPPRLSGLALEINYYDIRFSDRIALPSPTVAVVGDPAFETIITRDPDDSLVRDLVAGASVALDVSGPGFGNGNATPADVTVIVDGRVNNTAVTRTRGLDLNLRHTIQRGADQFLVRANTNYILSFKDRLRPTSPAVDALDTVYRPIDLRLRAQLGWNRGGSSANLFVNHAAGYRDTRGGRSVPINSYTTLDLGIAHEFGGEAPGFLRGTRLALHAENLLDTSPPHVLPDPGSTTGLGYDPVNATGRGRFVSLQLRRRW